jgi:ribose 5-phosphate isomerase B
MTNLSSSQTLKIFLASDHAGFGAKNSLRLILELWKKTQKLPIGEIFDLGPESEDSVHYPLFAFKAVEKFTNESRKEFGDKWYQQDQSRFGILICGSGIGVSISANKFQGIRASLCRDTEDARLAREHNHANFLCLGARNTSVEKMITILQIWLETTPLAGRHQERIEMMNQWGQII